MSGRIEIVDNSATSTVFIPRQRMGTAPHPSEEESAAPALGAGLVVAILRVATIFLVDLTCLP